MKAITIMQPYATLIMLGAKQWETRPAPPNGNMRPEGVRGLPGLRIDAGERIAIHAGMTKADVTKTGFEPWLPLVDNPATMELAGPLAFGALLGTVEVVRALPIVLSWYFSDVPVAIELNNQSPALVDDTDDKYEITDLADQYPYGDWQSGRWAWELANVERFDRPIPCKGKQGVWEVTP